MKIFYIRKYKMLSEHDNLSKVIPNLSNKLSKNELSKNEKDDWKNIDGLKKIDILKREGIKIDSFPIFGENYVLNYPGDLYTKKKTILSPDTLNKIRDMVLQDKGDGENIREHQRREVGGIINNNKIDFLFSGNKNRIKLDLQQKTQTLFHTHPEDPDVEFDPPSILDIVSFLALNVHSIAEFILNNEVDITKMLKVQNSAVFTKNEVYIYYISYPLLINISKYLMALYQKEYETNDKPNQYIHNMTHKFVYGVEKLLEEIELYYTEILYNFNKTFDEQMLNLYISKLCSLGIILKRFTYVFPPEIYINEFTNN